MQPVPPRARLCPHCGDRVQHLRHIPILLGLGALLILILVVFVVRHATRETLAEQSTITAPATTNP